MTIHKQTARLIDYYNIIIFVIKLIFRVKRFKFFISIFVYFTALTISFGQNWQPSLHGKNNTLNFFELQRNFQDYWNDREVTKGSGYKQFKRWEWYWETRVDENGNFPSAGRTLSEYTDYLSKHGQNRSNNRSTWQTLGPFSTFGGYFGIGRINSVAFHPTDVNTVYIGAAGGGIWKTTDGGNTYIALGDGLDAMGVSAIVIDPIDPNIIYIGTGDGDAADNYSVGVMKSTDGGNTWNTTGLSWASQSGFLIKRMIMDPDDQDVIIIATNDGIYRTTDAGGTWTKEISGSFFDIESVRESSTNTFFASTATKIYKSTDNGNNWTEKYSITGSNRIMIACSKNDLDKVYFVSSSSSGSGFKGLYMSEDQGENFSLVSSTPNILGYASDGSGTGGQGWYDLDIAIDPLNVDIVHIGGVNHWKSLDGGTTWILSSHWSGAPNVNTVHADKHALEYQNDTTLWEGNDGGIYKTIDDGANWFLKTGNLAISEMYRIGASQLDDKIITGLQDNGTKLKDNYNNWTDEIGGDGMDCQIDICSSNVLYGEYQNGNMFRSLDGGGQWVNISDNIPGTPTGNWITPIELSQQDAKTIFAGYTNLYKSTNRGDDWVTIGNTFGASSKINYVAIAPSDDNYIYVSKGSSLWRTTNGGTTWTSCTSPSYTITDMVVHPTGPDTLYITQSGYNDGVKVLKSEDGGTSWINISGSLPNIPANCIQTHHDGDSTLYVGMDIGVYYKNATSGDWVLYNTGLPNVEITDIDIDSESNQLFIATYGRGAWKNETVNTSDICYRPQNVEATSSSHDNLIMSWTHVNPIPSEGYEYKLSTDPDIPSSGTSITFDNTVTVTGLTTNTEYYFFIRSKCDVSDTSKWSCNGPFLTSYICGESYYDTGGAANDYSNQENIVQQLCPTNMDSTVHIQFNSFGVEEEWDALYVHNGNSIEAPLFDSGNSSTDAGFPAGGYYGFINPGPFTSTDSTGCLTIRFLSDTYVTESGWDIDITCEYACSHIVSNIEDDHWGSLRKAIQCANSGDTIPVASYLTGNTITLETKIDIDKDIYLLIGDTENITIQAADLGPVFNVLTGKTLQLKNINIISGTQLDGRAIVNSGILIFENVDIIDINANNTGSSILNNGQIEIRGTNSISN